MSGLPAWEEFRRNPGLADAEMDPYDLTAFTKWWKDDVKIEDQRKADKIDRKWIEAGRTNAKRIRSQRDAQEDWRIRYG